jgi:hypothetical protein
MRGTFLLALLVSLLACGDDGSGDGSSGPGPGGGASSSSASSGGAGGAGGGAMGGGGAGAAGGGAGGGSACSSGLPTVSFAADVQPIFTQSCAKTNCHKGTAPDVGLDLSAGKSHADIVGVATAECSGDRVRVIAGDPQQSYLFDKVVGVDLCGNSSRMPINSPKLSDAHLAVLEAWICGGALDD